MAIKLTQSLKQTQTLAMTPQLQQAIKLLTLTHMEMTDLIAEEMVENPLLEESSAEGEEVKEETIEEKYEVEHLEMENQEARAENFEEQSVVNKDDFDWESYIESYNNSSYSPPNMAVPDQDEIPNYENMVSKSMTLAEHLEWQLRMEYSSEEEWKVLRSIIHNINDDGYLIQPFEEIIAETGHNREDAFALLELVQRLDPVGCGSRDLVDCLLAQAKVSGISTPLLEKIIKEHLSDLQKKDYGHIAKTIGTTVAQVKEKALIIQGFNPRPGRLISPNETHYVVPDIYVQEVGGAFVVTLNDEGVPRLKVSQLYQSMLKQKDEKAKEFVQDKLRSAMWLIKSIQNRQRTIMKVAKSIVAQQQDFFKKGVKYLKPMILKDVAMEIGMHESTVSRVTTNKYMHTPIGLFELKYFFNTGLGGKDGGVDVASEVLKLKIKELIQNENLKIPLSDQKIAELLGREDIKIARRTVAKYREMLGIQTSSERKAR